MGTDATKLLTQVIELIGQDILHIATLVSQEKLPHQASIDLARYFTVLQETVTEAASLEAKERHAVGKLSSADLAALARKALADYDASVPK